MVDVHAAPGMQRAQPVGAGRQVDGNRTPLARCQQLLHDDMRRRCRTAEAEAADAQRADQWRGRERQLDVAREVAAIVDVARRAVGAARQLVQ
jgi:hypothetical protein